MQLDIFAQHRNLSCQRIYGWTPSGGRENGANHSLTFFMYTAEQAMIQGCFLIWVNMVKQETQRFPELFFTNSVKQLTK